MSEMASSKLDKYNFVADPDENLKCSICLDVASDPRQEEQCGKLFCKECIENNDDNRCPTCRTVNPQYFQDKKSFREINALAVFCDNVERGCKWDGTVETIGAHVETCGLSYVVCTKKCKVKGEQVKVLRKDLEVHLKEHCPNREYKCEYCGKKSTFKDIKENHQEACRNRMVCCPACSCYLQSEDLQKHIEKTCAYTFVPCKYKERLGCRERLKRKDMKLHEESAAGAHLQLALKKLEVLERDKTGINTGLLDTEEALDEINRTVKLEEGQDSAKGLLLEVESLIDQFSAEVRRTLSQLERSSDKSVSLEVLVSSLEVELSELTQKLKKTSATALSAMTSSELDLAKEEVELTRVAELEALRNTVADQKSWINNQEKIAEELERKALQFESGLFIRNLENDALKKRIAELASMLQSSGPMQSCHRYAMRPPQSSFPMLMQPPSQGHLMPVFSPPHGPPMPMMFEGRSATSRPPPPTIIPSPQASYKWPLLPSPRSTTSPRLVFGAPSQGLPLQFIPPQSQPSSHQPSPPYASGYNMAPHGLDVHSIHHTNRQPLDDPAKRYLSPPGSNSHGL